MIRILRSRARGQMAPLVDLQTKGILKKASAAELKVSPFPHTALVVSVAGPAGVLAGTDGREADASREYGGCDGSEKDGLRWCIHAPPLPPRLPPLVCLVGGPIWTVRKGADVPHTHRARGGRTPTSASPPTLITTADGLSPQCIYTASHVALRPPLPHPATSKAPSTAPHLPTATTAPHRDGVLLAGSIPRAARVCGCWPGSHRCWPCLTARTARAGPGASFLRRGTRRRRPCSRCAPHRRAAQRGPSWADDGWCMQHNLQQRKRYLKQHRRKS
jgi:hypothetical protein